MAQTLAVRASGRRPIVCGDRLSSLADDLLHTIMSFLSARQAVQTCVLSRRWVDLWTSMPCLNIDEQELDATESSSSDHDDFELKASGRFVDFMHGLLMFHRAPSLDAFRIRVTHYYRFQILERWLLRGIKYCPAVLEICNQVRSRLCQAPYLGSSSAHLKRLHLFKLHLDKTFLLQLRSGCSVLEDLELERCIIACPEFMSCTLKNLVIADCTTYEGNKLTITARALVSFGLVIDGVGWDYYSVLVNEMPSLAKASICLKSHLCVGRRGLAKKGPWKLLCSLVNVTDLKLSGPETLWILHERSETIPTFSNLQTLLFDECDLSDNSELLGCFLNNAPSLTKLTLQYCKLPEGSRKRKGETNSKKGSLKCQDRPEFQCPNLKLTEIKYSEDDAEELFDLLSGTWRSLQKSTIVLAQKPEEFSLNSICDAS